MAARRATHPSQHRKDCLFSPLAVWGGDGVERDGFDVCRLHDWVERPPRALLIRTMFHLNRKKIYSPRGLSSETEARITEY